MLLPPRVPLRQSQRCGGLAAGAAALGHAGSSRGRGRGMVVTPTKATHTTEALLLLVLVLPLLLRLCRRVRTSPTLALAATNRGLDRGRAQAQAWAWVWVRVVLAATTTTRPRTAAGLTDTPPLALTAALARGLTESTTMTMPTRRWASEGLTPRTPVALRVLRQDITTTNKVIYCALCAISKKNHERKHPIARLSSQFCVDNPEYPSHYPRNCMVLVVLRHTQEQNRNVCPMQRLG